MLTCTKLLNPADYQNRFPAQTFEQRLLFFAHGSVHLRWRGQALTVIGPAVVHHSPLAEILIIGADFPEATLLAFNQRTMDLLVAHAFQFLCPMTGVFSMNLTARQYAILEGQLSQMAEADWGADLQETHALLLVKYLAKFQSDSNSRRLADNDLVKQYVACVDQEHEAVHEINYYADRLGVSVRTLNRVFKSSTGITPKASLNYRLNLSAKRYLLEQQKSVKEISYGLGFTSPEYFHSFFRKSNGMTPGEYARLYS